MLLWSLAPIISMCLYSSKGEESDQLPAPLCSILLFKNFLIILLMMGVHDLTQTIHGGFLLSRREEFDIWVHCLLESRLKPALLSILEEFKNFIV